VGGKGELVETFPLFLSDTYQEYYDRSKNEMALTDTLDLKTQTTSKEDKRKSKGAAKLYKQAWL